MKLPGGRVTANIDEQLRAIHDAWKPYLNKFENNTADADAFMNFFGEHMKSHHMHVGDITPEALVKFARTLKPSSAGLDNWRPESLRALASWYPDIFSSLASIYNHIEKHGQWPQSLVTGYVALIPKESSTPEGGPGTLRPISVLSSVYRLWSGFRFQQCLTWQTKWAPKGMHGCMPKRGAESMAMCIAQDMEAPSYEYPETGGYVAGISYDFAKAFDVVPHDVMFRCLAKRGIDARVLLPLQGVYAQMKRVYRLRGSCSSLWTCANGILQGCALSMIGLNAMVASILEATEAFIPSVVPRAYADDISATAHDQRSDALIHNLRRFHSVVRAYEGFGCGDISNKKTFTFGDACIQGKLNPAYQHSPNFKIVGGSFKSQASDAGPTQVEEERLAKWKGTITRLKHIPLHWQRKAKMLVSTQSQAVYAQGTHTFQADEEELKKVRSTIMRTMWQADCYSMSPYVTCALLLPAQLDPLFGHKYHGLRTLARCMRQHDFAVEMRKRFLACNGHERDGPTIRLRQLYGDPVFRTAVHELLTDRELDEERWAHDLREIWRSRLWSLVSTERAQHYCDVQEVDVDRTMQYHNELRQLASQTNPDGDEGLEYDGPIGDARAKLSVLRRLFAGGLLTNERTARHKRQTGAKLCDCGAQQTVLHVSWECPLYANDRVFFTTLLTESVDALPVCTKYAGIVPMSCTLTSEQAVALHRMLVIIWQKHIKSFHEGGRAHQETLRIQEPVTDENPVSAGEYTENGHLLAPRVGNPGVYCRKCGKFVARMKHIRLKITSQPCAHKDAPPERWVSGEGWSQASARLDALEYDLHNKYNKGGHSLTWNRRVGKIAGKDDEGLITCVLCFRQWRWKDRVSNLPRTICNGPPFRPRYRVKRKTAPRLLERRDDSDVRVADARDAFQDTVLVDLVGGLSWGSCAPHAQANTNLWDPLEFVGFSGASLPGI